MNGTYTTNFWSAPTSTSNRYNFSTMFDVSKATDKRPLCTTCGHRVNPLDVAEHADYHANESLGLPFDAP